MTQRPLYNKSAYRIYTKCKCWWIFNSARSLIFFSDYVLTRSHCISNEIDTFQRQRYQMLNQIKDFWWTSRSQVNWIIRFESTIPLSLDFHQYFTLIFVRVILILFFFAVWKQTLPKILMSFVSWFHRVDILIQFSLQSVTISLDLYLGFLFIFAKLSLLLIFIFSTLPLLLCYNKKE